MDESHPYHKTVARIIRVLEDAGCSFQTFEHEAVRTSEEAAKVRPDYSIAQGAKALIVRIKRSRNQASDNRFAQFVVPGDKKFDVKKARTALAAKDIRFASEKEVLEITDGVVPGGVPPFGNLFGLSVYADERIFENDTMIFNAGDRRFSIAISTNDYMRVVHPCVVSLV